MPYFSGLAMFPKSPLFYVLLVIAGNAASAQTLGAETIKGTIRFAGVPIEQKTIPTTIDQYVCGKEKAAEVLLVSADKGIRNVVVSIENPPALGLRAPAPPVELDQKECTFVPHVVVAPINEPVLFLNTDRLLHNLHSISTLNARFNRAQPKGRTIQMAFKIPEKIRIECDLHTWMHAWVVVAEHPFYTVTNDRGAFVLENVPPGSYTLRVWQESLGTVTKDVAVAPQVGTDVIIEMSPVKP